MVIFSTVLVSSIFVGYTLNNLPLKDYRPFKVGTDFNHFYSADFEEVEINSSIFSIFDGFQDKMLLSMFLVSRILLFQLPLIILKQINLLIKKFKNCLKMQN